MTELDDLEARLAVGAAPGAFDAGRCLVEAAWVPTALLPRFGVTWTATDQHHLVAHQRVADAELDVEHEIDDEGRVLRSALDRWGAIPTGPARQRSTGSGSSRPATRRSTA